MIPINWAEWLVTIAIGFGACIVSWATRYVSRTCLVKDILALRKIDRARTSSAERSSLKGSMKGSMAGVSMRIPVPQSMSMKTVSKDTGTKVHPITY